MGNCLPRALTPPAPGKLIIPDLCPCPRAAVGTSQLLTLFQILLALFQFNQPTLATLLWPLNHNCIIFQLLDHLLSDNSASFVTKVTQQQTQCQVIWGTVRTPWLPQASELSSTGRAPSKSDSERFLNLCPPPPLDPHTLAGHLHRTQLSPEMFYIFLSISWIMIRMKGVRVTKTCSENLGFD